MRLQIVLGFILASSTAGFAATPPFTVAPDGSGDFKTMQEAVAAAPEKSGTPIVIHIKPGTYTGPVIVPQNKPNIIFRGDDAKTTILAYSKNVNEPRPPNADKFNPGLQILGNDFHAENITIENTSGNHGQALALRMDADRGMLVNCRLVGWQDTLMINNGRDLFQNCYIAGRVDFIYGSATAWFEHCELHTRNGGHVTAASTPQDHPFGFVFDHCSVTGDPIPWVSTTQPSPVPDKLSPIADLGRPWRPYASVTFLNCQIGNRISPAGWNNWRNPANEKTARFAEYHCTGPGADRSRRVPWSKELSDTEAARYTISNVIGGSDHWDPRPEFPTTQQSRN